SVNVRFGAEKKHISLTEASFAAALLLGVRPGVLTVAASMGIALVYTAKGTPPHKVAFNTGSYALAVTAAEVVFASLHSVSPALATGQTLTRVLAPIGPVEAAHAAGNLGLGAMAAAVWWIAPAALPALVVVSVACLAAYRALSPSGSTVTG